MQLPEKFTAYIDQVCDQLRWKKARPVIQREMEAHLCDQYDAFVKSGMPEEDAVEETLRRTGDAVEIGTGLDRVHRPKPSWGLLILTGILLLMGLSIKLFFTYDGDFPHELPTMLVAAVLGIGCLFGAYFMDFTILGKRPVLLCVCSIALMLFFIFAFDHVPNYRTTYFALVFPVIYAALLYKLRGKGYLGLLFSLLFLGFLSFVFCLIPSFRSMFTVAAVGLVLLTVAVWNDWFRLGKVCSCLILGTLVLLGIAVLCLYLFNSAFALQKIKLAFHPEVDPYGRGWSAMIIRELLAASNIIGPGNAVPYAAAKVPMILESTSLLLTALIYHAGWLTFLLIMVAFAAFLGVAIHKCLKQKNMLGKLISLAVILTLSMQIVLYVLINLGFYLVGDLSLPLVSYGNTALVIDMALIGIMLSTFRTGSLVRDDTSAVHSNKVWLCVKERIHWSDGELTISFKKNLAS